MDTLRVLRNRLPVPTSYTQLLKSRIGRTLSLFNFCRYISDRLFYYNIKAFHPLPLKWRGFHGLKPKSVNTERCCAKELAMWPHQTCPEHRHPPINSDNPGKEEIFRCRWGKMYLYVPGPEAVQPKATPPTGRENTYTVWNEIELCPGEQYTLLPNTLHSFQAGPDGAVVSEFYTHSLDEKDIFTDEEIARITQLAT